MIANCVVCQSKGTKAFTCSFPGCKCNGHANTKSCAIGKHILCDNDKCLDKAKMMLKNATPTVSDIMYDAMLNGDGPIKMVIDNCCKHKDDCINLENIKL